jgi:hypothetical protein
MQILNRIPVSVTSPDRQTDRQKTDRRQTDRQTHRQTDRQEAERAISPILTVIEVFIWNEGDLDA